MTTGHFQKLPKSGCRSEPLLQVPDHGHGSRTILHRISGVFIVVMKTLGSCREYKYALEGLHGEFREIAFRQADLEFRGFSGGFYGQSFWGCYFLSKGWRQMRGDREQQCAEVK